MTRRKWLLSASALAALRAAESDLIPVKARRKPSDQWSVYPTRSIHQLAGFQPGAKKIASGKFGGRLDRRTEPAGFFRVRKQNDRWWLSDPEGYLYIKAGVVSISPGKSATNRAALKSRFGTEEKWVEETVRLL